MKSRKFHIPDPDGKSFNTQVRLKRLIQGLVEAKKDHTVTYDNEKNTTTVSWDD